MAVPEQCATCAYRDMASVVSAHNNEKPAFFCKNIQWEKNTVHLSIVLVFKCQTCDRHVQPIRL